MKKCEEIVYESVRRSEVKKWEIVHHPKSGGTAYEKTVGACRLAIMPRNWSVPRGEATWTVSCGRYDDAAWFHKRGTSKTLKAAKARAGRVAADQIAQRRWWR